ncbi:MAG TPA: 50S ribosomal protein L23 [Verrucomicrobiae bacterium]|nr:50S ribosomal protein L23 [Verrucomicrobiae bacterium]
MTVISLIPRMSEKAYGSAQNNTYVFSVPVSANKQQIAQAVAEQYKVEVSDVHTLVSKGKVVRFSRGTRRMPGTAQRKDTKKAYVTLVEGSSIKIFDEADTKETK